MTAYEMQVIAKMVAENVFSMLVNDEKFIRKIMKSMPKNRMLNSKQAAELLGISPWQVRNIAEKIGGIKSNAKGDDEGSKHYGHYTFMEEGLVERYKEFLRTR